ncbi:MAG: sigma-70 family RNA polymerase sigma factor [Nocardioides sp.]
MSSAGSARTSGRTDREPPNWVEALTTGGPGHDAAVAELHALLLKVGRAEAARRTGWHGIRGTELDDLAHQAADDAVVSILRRVGDFRGESRFTTWAIAFVIREVSNKFFRHAYRRDAVQLGEEDWERLPAALGAGPEAVQESRALVDAVRAAVDDQLSPYQRAVFVALVLNGARIDGLAAELGTTRNALYQTMFDARRKLRKHLETHGYLETEGGKHGRR